MWVNYHTKESSRWIYLKGISSLSCKQMLCLCFELWSLLTYGKISNHLTLFWFSQISVVLNKQLNTYSMKKSSKLYHIWSLFIPGASSSAHAQNRLDMPFSIYFTKHLNTWIALIPKFTHLRMYSLCYSNCSNNNGQPQSIFGKIYVQITINPAPSV